MILKLERFIWERTLQINITGRNIQITPGIRSHIQDRVKRLNRYTHNVMEVHFILETQRYRHIAEIVLTMKQATQTVKENTEDMYFSIDKAIDKLEKWLGRHMEKIKHKPR